MFSGQDGVEQRQLIGADAVSEEIWAGDKHIGGFTLSDCVR